MDIRVKMAPELLTNIRTIFESLSEPMLVGLATEMQDMLSSQKPAPPRQGSGNFVSDKQRKFVMAAIRNGEIDVPYKRGVSPGSQRMNRSFKIKKAPSAVSVTNSASYWKYVIGNQQASIHQGRWTTVDKVRGELLRSGLPEKLVTKILRKYFD